MNNLSSLGSVPRRTALALVALGLGAPYAMAEVGFPTRQIRIICPFSAGTGADLIARAVAQRLAEETRQGVVVENRVGASGAIGAIAVARAAADGYTLLLGVSPFTIAAGLDPKVGYDPVKDFAPVAKIITAPLLFTVNGNLPFRTIRELLAHAKENPGKLTYGSSGSGTSAQIELESFKHATGANILEVPYKDTSQLVTDLLEGRISMYAGVAPVVMPHVRTGRLRVIAVLDSRRAPSLPDVPTLAEGLEMPGYVATPNWYGFLAPVGTPPDVIAKLNGLIRSAANSPEMSPLLERFGAQRYTPSNDEFSQQIKAEVEKIAALSKLLGAPK